MHTDSGEVHRFDQLLATLPTRLFARLAAADLPQEFVERYPGPEHYGAHVLILGLDRTLVPGVYWLNINDRDLPFLALVEHTNFLPPADYGGLHLVYLGNYLPMDHPLFGQSDEEVVTSYLAAIRHIRPDVDLGWVKQHWVFRAPFAQPIVTTDYLGTLPPHRHPAARRLPGQHGPRLPAGPRPELQPAPRRAHGENDARRSPELIASFCNVSCARSFSQQSLHLYS